LGKSVSQPAPGAKSFYFPRICVEWDSPNLRRVRFATWYIVGIMRLVAAVSFCLTAASALSGAPVTFNKDILPIMQDRCQECHRPGEAAPMPLTTYQQARPWAKAIKEAVAARRMPPWFADPHHGKFSNDRSLTGEEMQKIAAWVDAGAPEGDARDRPAPREFVEGWNIGKPDTVFSMGSEYLVPASGTIEYTYYVVPTGFTEDKWIQAAEVRPGNRSVVHHVIAFVRPPGSRWLAEAKPGIPYVPRRAGGSGGQQQQRGESAGDVGRDLLVGFAPGLPPMMLAPGQARLVKAGSDLIFQMHYTANGRAAADQTTVGVVFAREAPAKKMVMMGATNSRFVIPPGAPAHEVESQITLREDATLVSLMPHMHLRGKDFEFRAVFPTGEKQILLRVPRYDFNWQLFYYLKEPMLLPKGTRIECTAHFDNSANNKANPDPTKEVRWGDQSWEEMMIGWFDVAVDVNMDPARLRRGD
jgi:hypothetical protein